MSSLLQKRADRSTQAYEMYAQGNPELTRIKLAENFTRIQGMMDFKRRTGRNALVISAGLLLAALLFASVMGMRTMSASPTTSRSAFFSALEESLLRDSTVVGVTMLDSSNYYVYIEDAEENWDALSEGQQENRYRSIHKTLDDVCHTYRMIGMREKANLFLFDEETGRLLYQP